MVRASTERFTWVTSLISHGDPVRGVGYPHYSPRTQRLREVKYLLQSHTAVSDRAGSSETLNPRPCLFNSKAAPKTDQRPPLPANPTLLGYDPSILPAQWYFAHFPAPSAGTMLNSITFCHCPCSPPVALAGPACIAPLPLPPRPSVSLYPLKFFTLPTA